MQLCARILKTGVVCAYICIYVAKIDAKILEQTGFFIIY